MRRQFMWVIAAAFVFGQPLLAAQAPAPALEAKTQQVLELLMAGKYDVVYEMGSQAMKASGTADQYKTLLAQVLAQLAALGPAKRGAPAVHAVRDLTVVTISLTFPTEALTFVVAWNKSGEIEGTQFAPPARPQEPKLPFPYKSEAVTFDSRARGVKLSGTLTVPEGAGPFPAVVLVSGSGPTNRDERVFGHKVFLVLADYLTRHGIAVLRYDKRAFDKGLDEFYKAGVGDLASDAEGAFECLKARAEVDAKAIGFVGHSEGGIVVPMVAARRPDVRFVVLLGAPGVAGTQVMKLQAAKLAEAAGAGPAAIQQNAAIQDRIFAIVAEEKDDAAAQAKILALIGNGPGAQQEAQKDANAWARSFYFYDPAPTLEKVKCPVLALTGELDLQVFADQNLPPIEAALKKGGNTDFEVRRVPKLNHLFQTARTGAASEYTSIEETMSPVALEMVATWIKGHAQKKASDTARLKPRPTGADTSTR